MSFDLNAARKEQQERANAEFWAEDEAKAQLTAALDEIERLREHIKVCHIGEQLDVARELADKLATTGHDRCADPRCPDSEHRRITEIFAEYEAAKNPDGSWK